MRQGRDLIGCKGCVSKVLTGAAHCGQVHHNGTLSHQNKGEQIMKKLMFAAVVAVGCAATGFCEIEASNVG